ncbi:MAG: response regulator [Bacteroidales bacterium]|nr:response regulator [Bacteroidales bacterium]
MITQSSLIFIVEDDEAYASMLKTFLVKLGYTNIRLFISAERCLQNINLSPEVIITDYNLGETTGLKLLETAKDIGKCFYSILISGTFHKEHYNNEIPIHQIDKHIVKGQNELDILKSTLTHWSNSNYNIQYY